MKFFTPSHTLPQHQSEQSSPDSDINIHLKSSEQLGRNVSRSSKFILVKSLMVAIGGLAIPLMTGLAAQAAPLTCSTIYGDVYNSTQIYSISTTNAVPTAAAVLPVPSNIGIAVIPGVTPTLYSDSLSPIHLNSTNGTTTTNTPAASFSSSYRGGLGTDTLGRLFYIGNNGTGQHLWRFNSVTGPATDAGAITSSLAGDTVWPNMSPGDMMSDANGRLYYFGSDYVLSGGLYTNYLYYVDANLVAHRLGSYTSAQTGIGVAFDPSGTIFTLNRNLLYKIDLTAGFTASLVGDTKNPGFIDLGSCAMPTMNPAVSAIKTVQDITTVQNPATIVNTNDILQYNVTFTNTGNLPSDNTKFIDTIPAGSTYVASSTQICNAAGAACATIPDVGGIAPFIGTGALVKTAGQGAGVLLTGAANNAVLKFQVKVISTGTPAAIVNTGQASYPTVSGGLPTNNTVNTTTASVPVKVAPVTVSGTVFDDADGSKIKNGTEVLSTVAGLNAVLVDTTTSKVIATATVVNGVFSFSNVPGNVNYTVQITTATAVVGSAPPAVILPTNWVSTGENLNGVADNTIDGTIAVPVAVSNVINVNLGIEQLPNTTDLTPASQVNPGGTATVQVPALVGTDPEDNILSIVKKFKIVTLPTNGTLYYSGIAVTLGQVIANYDPLLLTIDPTANTADTINFTYAAIDLAGQQDPTPATVTMPFSASLINPANLVLVKRITAIKDSATNTLTTFSSFLDDGTTNNLLPGWNVGTGSYLLGSLSNGIAQVKPGDEVEYTIYYLNSGGSSISKARICDRLNKDLLFQTQFSTATTSTQGIEFVKDINTSYPSNAEADNDGGFFSTSSTLPSNCNLTANTTFNTNNISDNVVVVDVAKAANTTLGIANDPLLGGQRGYVKFKVIIQP
jgi:uncharacterized repeat protein (TIGR01451 family)